MPDTVTRRRALALLLGAPALTLACTRDAPDPSAEAAADPSTGADPGPDLSTTPPAPATTTPATTTPPPPLPDTTPWVPGPGEVQPEIKQAAALFLEQGGRWVGGAGPEAALTTAGVVPAVAATATALAADASASRLQVRYPQYGGIAPETAAVIALFDQHLLGPDGTVTTREQALDLRLRRPPGGAWAVERVNPLTSLGSTVALGPNARAVLADPRIELSAPSRLDVESGRMDERVLAVLLGVAAEHVLAVQVMHTGHIQTVYPTERVSNHAVGRAIDVRTVDGLAVVDPATPTELLTAVMVRAAQLGATEVGGPFDLNGERTGFFSDDVHQDHLHLGISQGKPPAQL